MHTYVAYASYPGGAARPASRPAVQTVEVTVASPRACSWAGRRIRRRRRRRMQAYNMDVGVNDS